MVIVRYTKTLKKVQNTPTLLWAKKEMQMNSQKSGKSGQIVNRKDHPIYSGHRQRRQLPSTMSAVAFEAEYPFIFWGTAVIVVFVILAIGGMFLGGCDDSPNNPPSDMVADADTYTTEVVGGDTVDTSNDTDATDTNNVDVVEVEVVSDPCADYMYITNPMWCCGENDACYWEDACKIYEKNEECLFICEKFTNGYEASVTDTLFEFNFPDIIRYSTSGTVTCVSQ